MGLNDLLDSIIEEVLTSEETSEGRSVEFEVRRELNRLMAEETGEDNVDPSELEKLVVMAMKYLRPLWVTVFAEAQSTYTKVLGRWFAAAARRTSPPAHPTPPPSPDLVTAQPNLCCASARVLAVAVKIVRTPVLSPPRSHELTSPPPPLMRSKTDSSRR